MKFSGYELLWLFFVYSFLGWIGETVYATIRQKKFANRGLINGPLCIIYGVGAVVISVTINELNGIWLFIFSMIYLTVIEWIAGHLIEKVYKERWWDYRERKWNLDGYICLFSSVLWGILGFLVIKFGNGLALLVFKLCPSFIIELIIWIFAAVLAVDILASYMLVTGRKGRFDKLERANNAIANATAKLGKWIALHVEKRITKAYPQMEKSAGAEKEAGFAKGCSFYKIILLFFIGAFLGDVTETIFCRLTAGVWMSRSSVVWGPFSIVWGFAIAAVTLLLYKYKDRSDSFLFGTGTLLGGAYEYLCSVFTEIVFGKIFWDYSGMPFNLGGRINLLYCFFWGIAAVVWFKKLYPKISGLIEKIPHLAGKIITWTLIIFMCCNIVVSCMALIRYDERGNDVKADRAWKAYMDEHYGDEKMQLIYPNAKMTD